MFRKIMNIVSTVLLILLVGVVIFIFVTRISGQSPSLFGYHIFRVSSDSMVPVLEVGDIIVVKEVPVEEIEMGDIITYNGTEGSVSGKTITHQVILAPYEENGVWYMQTRGMAERVTSDDPVISYDQVIGEYVRTLPFINNMYNFFLSPVGLIVFIAIILILFGYEMISLISTYRASEEYDEEYYAPRNKKKSKKRKK